MRARTVVSLLCAVVLTRSTARAAGAPEAPPDPRQGYRFVVEAVERGKTVLRGLVTVDGKNRLVERAETPFEFQCEAGTVIAGYFESMTPGRSLRLRVYDPEYSKRHSALTMKGFEHIRFSWAQPGSGPRCADQGQGSCPSSTPSVEEFQRRLEESLREQQAGE